MLYEFDERGYLRSSVNYNEGMMEGLLRHFEGGLLVEEVPVHNGTQTGPYQSYSSLGEPIGQTYTPTRNPNIVRSYDLDYGN
jgi:antitoxin component YwqK of YwqJK toxin-antitoxin module